MIVIINIVGVFFSVKLLIEFCIRKKRFITKFRLLAPTLRYSKAGVLSDYETVPIICIQLVFDGNIIVSVLVQWQFMHDTVDRVELLARSVLIAICSHPLE